MDCSRHNGWNHPIRVHLTFDQTQLVEMVKWQVQYIKKQGFWFSLQLTQCKRKAPNILPTLKGYYLSIRLTHLQMSQSTETVTLSKLVMWQVQPIMFAWWQYSSKSVYFASQGKTGVYILPLEIIVTCEIISFVYMPWRKYCTVMSFSCSLKIFGWRQNSSRSV